MPQQKAHSFDVIVVGSGASGGWACKRLAEAGLKVALLEAGRPQSDKNFTEHKPEFELKYRSSSARHGPSRSNSAFATNIRTTGS
jgi:choline dehydrogenase-like flavoprotein